MNTTDSQPENTPLIPEVVDDTPTDIDPKYTTGRTKDQWTPLETIRHLITTKGNTYEEAGKILGVSKQAIQQRCHRHGIIPKRQLARFKEQEADILSEKKRVLLKTLTEEDIKENTSPYQRVGMYGILNQNEQLLSGKPTGIVGLHGHIEACNGSAAEIARLEKEMAELEAGKEQDRG